MTEIIALVSNLGSAAAAVIVTIYFLKHISAESRSQKEYLENQSKLHENAFSAIIDRVETMEEVSRVAYEKATNKLESLVAVFRSDERDDHQQLLSLSKDYASLASSVNDKLERFTEKAVKKGV